MPGLLRSLKQQDLVPHEIIIIDDFSEDKTKQIAEQEGIIVLSSAPHPEGWQGKTWVCYQGAQRATGDILVFLDADTMLEKDGLRRMIETYKQVNGILSLQPFHKIKKVYEELSAFFNIIVMGAMGSFTILGKTINPAGLFGPVLIISKDKYLQYDGHSIVKNEIMEHMSYGSSVKDKGENIYCYGGKHTISFRMYPNGIGDLINGWSKGFASGAMKTSISILVVIVLWIVGASGTARILIQECITGDTIQMIQWVFLYVCYVMQIYWMIRRIGNFKFYTALFYPIPLLFFVVVFIYSLIRVFVLKKAVWKGRTINT